MELKQLVEIAAKSIQNLFGDQGISNILLEEIEKDDRGYHLVTMGFDRTAGNGYGSTGIAALIGRGRVFKVVKIDQAGNVVSIKDRLLK